MKLILLIYFGILGLTGSKFFYSGGSWNEAYNINVLLAFLA
jgi:hypothetical protein